MKRTSTWFALLIVIALVATACSSSSDDTDTTQASGDTTATTQPATDTTQAASDTTQATTAPDAGFVGKVVANEGGCSEDYNGRVNTITALDLALRQNDILIPPTRLSRPGFWEGRPDLLRSFLRFRTPSRRQCVAMPSVVRPWRRWSTSPH